MIRIAVVEDEYEYAAALEKYIKCFCNERGLEYSVDICRSAAAFRVFDGCDFDIVFMDIVMPDGNGYDLVSDMRRAGKNTVVLFVTNMIDYAVKGYEVRAFDFIVKPVDYYVFSLKLQAALECLKRNDDDDKEIWVSGKKFRRKVSLSDIYYIDINNHYLTYHTTKGNFSVYGILENARRELGDAFAMCNRCYLVNLGHVSDISDNRVTVGGVELYISRNKRTSFVGALNDYISVGGKSYDG